MFSLGVWFRKMKKSQKESMKVQRTDKIVSIQSYQNYQMKLDDHDQVIEITNKRSKYQTKINLIQQFMTQQMGSVKTMIDIGCSNGFFCYLANMVGIPEVLGIDHDTEYIKKLTSLNLNNGVTFQQAGFGEVDETADLVLATALIHWLFSHTTNLRSLDKIVEILAEMTHKFLIIEWVDSHDSAILDFKHLDYRDPKILAQYNETVFQEALKKHFTTFECLGVSKKGGTRKLYVATK